MSLPSAAQRPNRATPGFLPASLVLTVLLLAGCPRPSAPDNGGDATPNEPVTAAPTPAPATPCAGPVAHEPAPTELAGSWSATGEWPVQLDLTDTGGLVRRDLISPCPPDVACVWSGIVNNNADYTVDGAAVNLSWTTSAQHAGKPVLVPSLLATVDCEGAVTLTEQGEGEGLGFRRGAAPATPPISAGGAGAGPATPK